MKADISSKRIRKFLPRPIETSCRSSKGCQSNPPTETDSWMEEYPAATKPDSRPTSNIQLNPHTSLQHSEPEQNVPVSSSDALQRREPVKGQQTRRRLPEPVETTRRSNQPPQSDSTSVGNNTDPNTKMRPRKFTPQLMETTKRSFRRGTPSHLSDDIFLSGRPSRSQTPINSSSDTSVCTGAHNVMESRFSYSSLRRLHETRRHSFRVPDLPAIPSSCSEPSDEAEPPSLSASPSMSSCGSVKRSKAKEDCRESCDEQLEKYLLSLAARSAENQLKEQALAAFPNEQVYEPVDHFTIDRDEEEFPKEALYLRESEVHGSRRASSLDLSWELEYLRQHKEEAEMRDRAMAGTKGARLSSVAITARQVFNGAGHPLFFDEGWKDSESARMKHLARPPMLGDDLIFQQSLSPDSTICENGSGHNPEFQNQLCNDSNLWRAKTQLDDNFNSSGLWMGTCSINKHSQTSPKPLPARITTPIHDREESLFICQDGAQLPPDFLNKSSSHGDGKQELDFEEDSSYEFHNEFVTQIYNYLSLGYPCVARYYDHELSKVSGISVEDLRRDDLHTDARGYVGISRGPADYGGVLAHACVRWVALRLYICEWARQQPKIAEGDSNFSAWGVRERRGSWAI